MDNEILSRKQQEAKWLADYTLSKEQLAQLFETKAKRNLQYMAKLQLKQNKSWESKLIA